MYKIASVFINSKGGIVEVTSTEEFLVKDFINYTRDVLELPTNKIQPNLFKTKILNVTLISLENDTFSIFWKTIEYLGNNGWEPFAHLGDAMSFRKEICEIVKQEVEEKGI